MVKLESDYSPLKLVKLDLCALATDMGSVFRQQFSAKEVIPSFEIPADSVIVWAVPDLMERIMYNLLSNALRYGHSGGVIGITVCAEQKTARIEVWDKGPGIKESDLPHIFERLYAGEASRKSALKGSGLGLSIAKNLAEKQTEHLP